VLGRDYLLLDEAARRSGYHPVTLMRLLRAGVIRGAKEVVRGRRRWVVEARSLREYTESAATFESHRPGPRLYLRGWRER
jgi:hypothetical protein